MTLLWLDDYRDPLDQNVDWMIFSPIGRDVDIVWVKSYDEFCTYLDNNPMPDGICFDHDLGDEQSYVNISANEITHEKTGYSAAKYLVEKCIGTHTRLPKFNSQSSNPVGRENIISYLNNFIKHNPDLSPG